jgi:single-stranded DNA-binding protein
MGQEKGENSCLTSVTIIGFVGADPEQRQARNNNSSKFTALSVATQRSWKNTDDKWPSHRCVGRCLVIVPLFASLFFERAGQ